MAANRVQGAVAGGMIYLDYQATTPVAPEVAKAMRPWEEEKFANPHSPSRWGREAEAAIEVARKQVEKAIGLTGGSVAFTGSATEAVNWALKGTFEKALEGRTASRKRIITLATEHAAVLDTCEWLAGRGIDLTVLPVGRDGRIDLEDLARELDAGLGDEDVSRPGGQEVRHVEAAGAARQRRDALLEQDPLDQLGLGEVARDRHPHGLAASATRLDLPGPLGPLVDRPHLGGAGRAEQHPAAPAEPLVLPVARVDRPAAAADEGAIRRRRDPPPRPCRR